MAEPRKVFRIEQTDALRSDPLAQGERSPQLADIMQELSALRAMLANASPLFPVRADASRRDEIDRLTGELRFVRVALTGATQAHESEHSSRASVQSPLIVSELEAAVAGSEQAAEKILAAAENIDQAANNLSATFKGELEQGLAQDIRDRVIRIFEACNYQDLTSQRVAKVIAVLRRIERQISRVLEEPARAASAPLANGPRLPQDQGHVSQSDIDAIFAIEVKSA